MRYAILMTLAVCAFGQTSATPPVVEQHRAFQPPDWLKRQYHIDPAKPTAPGAIQPFAAPGFGGSGFGAKGLALASRAIIAQKMRDCAVPLSNHWHKTPGVVFPMPAIQPQGWVPLPGEVIQPMRVCGDGK